MLFEIQVFEWWLKDRNERGLVEIIAAKQDQKNYRSRNIKSKPRQEVISEKKDEAVLSQTCFTKR